MVGVSIHADDGGIPGDVVATSTIDPTDVTATAQYLTARFIQAPSITGPAHIAVYMQEYNTGSIQASHTNNSTSALISGDRGSSWAAAGTYSLNYEVLTSDTGGVKGRPFRSIRSDNTRLTFFAHGQDVYSVNDGTGATTSIATGLNATATKYRYTQVQDKLYYVNGVDLPHVYDFTTDQVFTDPETPIAHNIIEYKGLIFLMDANDRTRIQWSEFAQFESYISTDFAYIDAPKKADFLTAFAKLGNLVIFARNNKFVLYGDDNATFSLDEAPGQKGTFSQESVVYDANYAYFASDDGIYRFDGTHDKLISVDILNDYLDLNTKDNIALEIHQNRLYVWYTPNGETDNSKCWVYNINLEIWESTDTNTYIGSAFARFDTEELFIQASNRVGAIYYGERESNNNHNLGAPLQYDLRTEYRTWGQPRRLKEVRQWTATLGVGGSGYKPKLAYAKDLIDAPVTSLEADIVSSAPKWDDGISQWDSGIQYDGGDMTRDVKTSIAGCHNRIQMRYNHYAAYEPVSWYGHNFRVHTMRLR